MHRAAGILIGLAACSFQISTSTRGDGGADADNDAPIDAVVTDVPMSLCLTWHPHHFDPCTIPGPAAPLDFSQAGTYTLNTLTGTLLPPNGAAIALSSAPLAQGGGPMAFLISVEGLIVRAGATLRVVGDKPLIVASWGPISVAGVIDVGSHLSTIDRPLPAPAELITTVSLGAGANPSLCSAGAATAGGAGASGTGGGGGGGFGGTGGAGGKGDSGGVIPGGAAGASRNAPSFVRGGCGGAVSGSPNASTGLVLPSTTTTTSPAGPGGGAIQLTARTALAIAGTITAGGAGGGPAQHGSGCGGGGAGAGGMIGLEGATMMISAGTLAANGGGGGSSGLFASRGYAGQDGQASSVAAIGGQGDGTSCALQGPSGSAGSSLAGGGVAPTTFADCGGAGGGGGAGHILVWGTLNGTTSTISPPVQPGPP